MPNDTRVVTRKSTSAGVVQVLICLFLSAAIMAAAIAWFYRTGATLYSGDAEAHLDIARRIFDSRTPGWSQVGTTWLPLPHLLMIPSGAEGLDVAHGSGGRHRFRRVDERRRRVPVRLGSPDFPGTAAALVGGGRVSPEPEHALSGIRFR